MEDIIICGSRKHSSADIDNIVDSFQTIVRHNMLVSGCGYGLKNSNIQVMNSHVYKNYKSFNSIKAWEKKYSDAYKTNDGHIEKFYDYIRQENETKYVSFPNNNSKVINKARKTHDIKSQIGQPKCGLAYIAECIDKKIKPFLIGYSISNGTIKQHQYNNHKNLYHGHNHSGETEFLCELHQKGLVDASLCLITDNGLSEEFEPTDYAKERWDLK